MAKPVILTVDDDPRVGQAVGRDLERRCTHEQTLFLSATHAQRPELAP
jgi:hypothetical protein